MIPKFLRLENFLSHSESEINFEKFDMALIMGVYDHESDQSNGSGKSALLESMVWALFGKSRHKKKNGVVKWDKTSCEVEFEFWVDNVLYRINRFRDKTVDGSNVILSQWNETNQSFFDISCDTNTATDKKIINTIHVNYDVFVNSVYFKQNDISMFAESTPGKRKDILKSLLRLDKWDKYQKKAKEKAKAILTQINSKSQNIVSIDNIENDLLAVNKNIEKLKKLIDQNNKEYLVDDNNLLNLKVEYQSIYDSDIDQKLKQLRAEHSKTKKCINEIEQQKSKNNNVITQNTNKISSITQKINVLNNKIKTAKKINLQSLKDKVLRGSASEQSLKDQIKVLKTNIGLGDECDNCLRPIAKKDIGKIKTLRAKKLKIKEEKCSELKAQLKRANAKLQQLEAAVEDGQKAEISKNKMQLQKSTLKNEIDECISSNSKLESEQKSLKKRNFKTEIFDLQERFNKTKEEELKKNIAILEKKLKSSKINRDKLNVEYGSKIRTRDELIETKKKQFKYQNELDALNNKYIVYSKLRDYFGKDGIQSVIIENIIEELEDYTNDTLSKICNEPTSISIKTQKQTDSGSWIETFDIEVKAGSRTDDFDTFSGGEQFRISLALRLALSNILSKRVGGTMRFLLLDEVSSNLDNKGLDMFINIIKYLSNTMKVLIITHDEALKEKIDDVILVNKGPDGSSVSFV